MKRARRLVVSVFVLTSLAGTALVFQGSAASSAMSRTAAAEHVRGSMPARPSGLQKLDTPLADLASSKPVRSSSGGYRLETAPVLRNGRVKVEIETARPAAARAAVVRLGGHVEAAYRGLIEAFVPKRSLAALSHEGSVKFVREPLKGVPDDVPGEEVGASMAAAVHAAGVTGKGTKIAIIDGTFAGLADRQASGDLPPNVVTQDFCGGRFGAGDGHGTAVAEIVHEMAPDAQLYLLCFDTISDLAAAEAFAKSQGVQIVNFSVEYFNVGRGTNDPSDPVDAIVADARANGILWVNSAGNDADTHWAGNFVDTNADNFMDFASGDEGNTFIWPNGAVTCGFLKWDEWPNAQSDFGLVLALSSDGTIIDVSDDTQNGSQPPTEELCVQNSSGSDQIVFWAIYGGRVVTNPRLDLYTIDSFRLQYQTPASSIGDPASSPSAFAVGAVCWQNNALEFYSSQGPTVDGRVKPDIAGHDSVSGATFGPFTGSCPSGFAGTSASSPEVAGAAALVKQANPQFSATQIATFLQQNALDVGAAGADDQTGAGALRLPTLVVPKDTTPPTAKALASKGIRGHLMKLLSRVADDSGQVKIRDQVKQNGQVIKTFTTGFVAAAKPSTGYFTWKVPPKLKGIITHCVRGQDRAGNVSKISCAGVTLHG
jgi:subtilisin family serine protease